MTASIKHSDRTRGAFPRSLVAEGRCYITQSEGTWGYSDTTRTLLNYHLLVADRDDMVVKALSWALRALSQRDAQAVRDFLIEYQGQVAARVVREVQHKLATGLKTPRRTSAKHTESASSASS